MRKMPLILESKGERCTWLKEALSSITTSFITPHDSCPRVTCRPLNQHTVHCLYLKEILRLYVSEKRKMNRRLLAVCTQSNCHHDIIIARLVYTLKSPKSLPIKIDGLMVKTRRPLMLTSIWYHALDGIGWTAKSNRC